MPTRRSLTWILAALLGAASVPASAAVFTVNTTVDSNDSSCGATCSLRDAVLAANLSPGADTVVLGSGLTYTFTIASPVTITDALTITGNNSTVDGNGLSGVFNVQGSIAVTFNNLTIRGGSTTGFLSSGGGINIQHASVTLNNCTVTANAAAVAAGSGNDGGGIAAFGSFDPANGATLAHLTLNNSTVSGNTAAAGGGIACVLCALTVFNSTISGNAANSGDGGGIDMVGDASTLTISNSTLTSNSAANGDGGGLAIPFGASSSSLTANRIVSNTAAATQEIFDSSGLVYAINNWWGSNSGPSPTAISASVITSPYLVLTASAAPTIITLGGGSTLTGSLRFNSAGSDTSAGGTVPDGVSSSFSGTGGAFVTPFPSTSAGTVADFYTASGPKGTATLTVTVDGQPASAIIHIGYLPFTDDPIIAGVTVVRAVHMSELRSRIASIRQGLGLGAYAYANSAAAGTIIRAQDIVDLRNALAQAYTAAGKTLPTYTDPTLAPGVIIKGVHISELRLAVIAME